MERPKGKYVNPKLNLSQTQHRYGRGNCAVRKKNPKFPVLDMEALKKNLINKMVVICNTGTAGFVLEEIKCIHILQCCAPVKAA